MKKETQIGFSGYLLVEGINIGAAIFDTNQLSIIRGGSLLLKQAVETLPRQFSQLQEISTGASSGLFGLHSPDSALVDNIAEYLSRHNEYKHLTFAVADTCESDFQNAKEILRAKIRIAQLRQISAAPDSVDLNKQAVPCAIDGIRRAYLVADKHPPGDEFKGKPLSASCMARFEYGRHYRQKLYRQELGALMRDHKRKTSELPPELLATFSQLRHRRFSENFHKIADNPAYGNLHNKLAIIYFDGNDFGKIQRELVKDAKAQKLFDRQVKALRRDFLAKLLERWLGHDEKEDIIRLETLLWGGDEMLFVVPAWRGFELMRLFYAVSHGWTVELEDPEGKPQSRRLTHAGGLVFCNYKTPIARMTELAQDLANGVKNTPGGRDDNFFDYIALESVDYPAEPLADFFSQRYRRISSSRPLLRFPPPDAGDAQSVSAMRELRGVLKDLPRSQIFQLARLAASLPTAPATTPQERAEEDKIRQDFIDQTRRLQMLHPEASSPFATIPALLHTLAGLPKAAAPPADKNFLLRELLADPSQADNPNYAPTHKDLNLAAYAAVGWRWLHLAECWDYLAPAEPAKKGNGHA